MKEFGPAEKSAPSHQSFPKKGIAASTVIVGAGLLATNSGVFADGDGGKENSGRSTSDDVAILRLLAAAEIIESDLWLHCQELAAVLDGEVAQRADAARRQR